MPTYILADEKHSRCLTERVYLPTIVSGRVVWHLGYSESKSVAAFNASYGDLQRIANQEDPSYRVKGTLTDGFDSTVLDQAHNAIDCKLFAMKSFHHPRGSQGAFLTGLAHLYNLILYQRRALNAGKCGVEVEGSRVPTSDWMLNLQLLTSGGYQCVPAPPHH